MNNILAMIGLIIETHTRYITPCELLLYSEIENTMIIEDVTLLLLSLVHRADLHARSLSCTMLIWLLTPRDAIEYCRIPIQGSTKTQGDNA